MSAAFRRVLSPASSPAAQTMSMRTGDGAAAAQPAAQQDQSSRDRSGSAAARGARGRAGGEDGRRTGDASRGRGDAAGHSPRHHRRHHAERGRAEEAGRRQIGRPTRSARSKDLEKYERIFADAAFWKKLGEEYENPLIITGTIMFTPQQTAGFVQRESRSLRPARAAASVIQSRIYQERKGFILEPKFVFIDGRTGATLHSETHRRESPLPLAAEHAGAGDLLRADGSADPRLPGRPEHPEDPRHAASC